MIDELLALFEKVARGWVELDGRPKHLFLGLEQQAVDVKTAIYKIGLGVIGKDEPAFLYGSKEQMAMDEADRFENDLAMARNALKASQRKAWAKACGVAEK